MRTKLEGALRRAQSEREATRQQVEAAAKGLDLALYDPLLKELSEKAQALTASMRAMDARRPSIAADGLRREAEAWERMLWDVMVALQVPQLMSDRDVPLTAEARREILGECHRMLAAALEEITPLEGEEGFSVRSGRSTRK